MILRKGDGNGGGDHIQVQLQGIDFDEGNFPAFRKGLKNGIFVQRFRRIIPALEVQGHKGIDKDKRPVALFIKNGLRLFGAAALELFDQIETVAIKVPRLLK
jgi:hypothetical protein